MNNLLKTSLVAGLTVVGSALTSFGSMRPVDAAVMIGSPMDNGQHTVNFSIHSLAAVAEPLNFQVNPGGPVQLTGSQNDTGFLSFYNFAPTNFVIANATSIKAGEVFSYIATNGTGGEADYNITVSAVPEPSNVLATLAFGAFAAWQLKGRKKSQKSVAQLVSKS